MDQLGLSSRDGRKVGSGSALGHDPEGSRASFRRRPVEEPAASKRRDHALPDAIDLLEVRVAREDELVDTELVVLGYSLRDLLMAADEGRSGSASDEPDSRPVVGRDLERVDPAFVERRHPALPLRSGGPLHRLGLRNSVGAHPVI
jgi:hypothetical protein